MEVYVEPTQELTASDLGRLSRKVSKIIDWPVLLWVCADGDEDILSGERVTPSRANSPATTRSRRSACLIISCASEREPSHASLSWRTRKSP